MDQKLIAPIVFSVSIFLSAALLFFVQPLFAKLVLPKIGGASGVWTTAMLFFQVVLIAGYVYSHLITRLLPVKIQLIVHGAFWAASLAFLPLAVSSNWLYDPEQSTALQTLILFAIGVGVPFAMLSANAPLLQAWYTRTNGPSADDPYFLYGASNFGSLLALLSFPLLAEPLLRISQISVIWSFVFVLFGVFLIICGLMARHEKTETLQGPSTREDKIAISDIGIWLLIAFVPSSLMLSITTKISTDLGSFPLVWVIPLSIYILSFVLAFSNRTWISDHLSNTLFVISLAVLSMLFIPYMNLISTSVTALIFAPLLLIVAFYAHKLLYNLRPSAGNLTVFYITMSVGGALGGLFNSIIAPTFFDTVIEGQVSTLLAASLLLFTRNKLKPWMFLVGMVIAVIIFAGGLYQYVVLKDIQQRIVSFGLLAIFMLVLFLLRRKPTVVFVAVSFLILINFSVDLKPTVFEDRSFFGKHTVVDNTEENTRLYSNGTTLHGIQRLTDMDADPTPLSYYHPQSPMAQVLTSERGKASETIGIVGLGVGSLACYAQTGQDWHFYEIDKTVDQIARDTSLFTFMHHCAPDAPTHLGDARIVLDDQDLLFDVLVLDAYSSDAIPVHLITLEAVQLYLRRLSEDGILVFHISNRYYDIAPPLARIAGKLGIHAAIRSDLSDSNANWEVGSTASVVVVASRDPEWIEHLSETKQWNVLQADQKPVWTDDYANLLSALK
ncbi:fused MFS/spermidine synthase [Sulfitobacter sp. 1151]|uniref:Fused MFS/spermidine synthase n=2 Tax=Parasulfitobacter algicola TaxID=2614809 RepID=A0ABX2ISL8_9RHOB|nr:fused MFS/spermidine synthase [Sulfitobacter algicola]